MVRIGPIIIMSTKTREAYRNLANKSYVLHQTIWYGELDNPKTQEQIRKEDAGLSEALSYTPASDIDS